VSVEERRLIRCFQAVFEGLSPEDAAAASTETIDRWDSLHAIVLIAVLEEEFEIRIPAHAYPALRSYDSVRDYLHTAVKG